MTAFAILYLMLATGFFTFGSLTLGFTEQVGTQTCASYDHDAANIVVECDSSLETIHKDIADDQEGDSALTADDDDWILDANVLVGEGATLTLDTKGSWLRIMNAHGIIIDGGRLNINNSRVTSWSEEGDVINQNSEGTNERAFIQIRDSDGVLITHSEFGYLGYNDPGKRGFDVFGEPSSNIQIINSEFHHMWMAFYSREASDIVVNGSEYHHNVKYALDPHTGTNHMLITNNHLHHNPIGVICSFDCSDIVIEENVVHDNSKSGIFLSRNMYDSIVRNNTVYGEVIGIIVSESPNNEIVDNKIHASERGISLFNPINPDDGETEDNIIHNNTITGAEWGIAAIRSQDNVLENNDFSYVEFEYYMTDDSAIIIQNQTFNDYEIRGSGGTNVVEIADSGIVSMEDEINDSNSDSVREQLTHDILVVDSR